MSSRYPILDNRPIDQWKVTELKEELKRRKLTIKGLKEDLIKRLDEALRVEREANEASEKDEANEANEKDEANGLDCDPQPVAGLKDSQTSTVVAEVVDTIARESAEIVETTAAEMENTSTVKQVEKENTGTVEQVEKENTGTVEQVEKENVEDISVDAENESTKSDKLNAVSVPVDVNNCVTPSVEEVGPTNLPVSVNSASLEEELVFHGPTVETNNAVTESVTEVVVSCQDTYSTEIKKDNGELASELETEDSKVRLETEDSKACLEIEDPKPHLESDLKMDIVPNSSIPENQVSEVNHRLGSQVKSDSISSDCVSINEKNELKDNIITDNVKLEQNVIGPEVVEPSPSNFVPVYGGSHSMDVGELHEKKAFVEENTNNSTSPDLKKINGSEDAGCPEKLNLDRSSGDDSMEEDLLESKQFDSKFNDDELREKSKCSEMPIVKEDIGTKVVGDVLSAGKSDIHHDNDISPVVSAEKRKFHDQATVGDEPAKRLRRWNSERIKGPDPPTTTPASTPKNESTAVKHNFSRSESSATDDAPRDHIVPPPQKSPTNSLRIDRFLRPFTLKAVQELLGKTGKVITFWMDHIKTHCYVTYSSVEEAIETRNAVYNLQWPPNGGRLLVAEYVDPEVVKLKVETPVQAAPVSSSPTVPPTQPTPQSAPSPRQHREQPPVQPSLPPPPPLSKIPPASRERLPPPPPLPENVDPPFVTLDDLFRKTRATPRIYYLPLSEEQVAAKLAAQGKSTKQ